MILLRIGAFVLLGAHIILSAAFAEPTDFSNQSSSSQCSVRAEFYDPLIMAKTMANPEEFKEFMAVMSQPETSQIMMSCASNPEQWAAWMTKVSDPNKMMNTMMVFMNPQFYLRWMTAFMNPAFYKPPM